MQEEAKETTESNKGMDRHTLLRRLGDMEILLVPLEVSLNSAESGSTQLDIKEVKRIVSYLRKMLVSIQTKI